MADAAIAASEDSEVWVVTVKPTSEFVNAGGREQMAALIQPYADKIKLVYAPASFLFEFGTGAYRSSIYTRLIMENVPEGTPLVVSDDMDVWNAASRVAGSYPMIGVLHGDQDHYYDIAIAYKAYLTLAACVSGRIGRKLAEKCPAIARDRIKVISCGINLPAMTKSADAHAEIRMAFVGRLTDHEKRAYDLVNICAMLYRQGVAFRLHIAGDSATSRPEYAEMLRKEGVEEYVTFHGWLGNDGVQDLLRRTDVLLLTSNSEGMPVSMMEALAAGCGFVGTRVSGVEDMEHLPMAKDCIGVYSIGGIADAVDKIKAVAAIPTDRRMRAARTVAEQEFAMKKCLERYWNAIAAVPPANAAPGNTQMSAVGKWTSAARALARFARVKWSK
ncbi:hypothetical protein GCM10023093_01140 [Nemorincola caseinilytica]|uniref:Glycosyltransferase n=2 Tax=Nemorincola caseinilytica TaxID=2054315 RepID=A0ABP8N1J7_9BACT